MFTTVAKFMDRAGSHKTYRDFLKASEPPAIPYLGTPRPTQPSLLLGQQKHHYSLINTTITTP